MLMRVNPYDGSWCEEERWFDFDPDLEVYANPFLFIPDNNSQAPADAVSYQHLKEQVGDVLDSISQREKRVLELRFGLEDGRSRTLEEVGREFGVTRERIRQIEAKALRKLRHPTRSKKLRDFLE